MTHWVWKTLDIAPTDDTRAIRSAYAAILKSFDPDEDLARFARLREARELALRLARSAAPLPEEPADIHVSPFEPDAPAPSRDDGPATWSPPEAPREDPADAHYAALVAMLSARGDGRSPDAARAARMGELLEAILADPRMQQLTFRAAAEDRLLHLLSTTTPQSDPLLPRAIDEFGWRQRGGQLSQPEVLDALIRYADDTKRRHHLLDSVAQFRADLQNPAHEHHRAWRDLTGKGVVRPAGTQLSVQRINTLLAALHQYFPQLLGELDQERVRFWEEQSRRRQRSKDRIGGALVLLVIAAVIAILALSPASDKQTPHRTSVAELAGDSESLTTVDADLGPALKQVLPDTSAADIARWNPTLYAALESRWNAAQRGYVARAYFTRTTVDWLNDLFAANLDRAPRTDIEEYRQIEAHRLKMLDDIDSAACAAVLDGKPAPPLDPDYRERLTTLRGRLILDVPYRPLPADAPVARRYRIPGVAVGLMIKRTGLSAERLSTALDRKGPAHAQCAARIALIEVALHLQTKEGLTLLRDM